MTIKIYYSLIKLDDGILLNVLLLLYVIDTYHHITLSRNFVILSQIIHIRIPHATPVFILQTAQLGLIVICILQSINDSIFLA